MNIFVMVLLLFSVFQTTPIQNRAHAMTTGSVNRVYTDKARYNPGDTAIITAQITNTSGSSWSGNVSVTVNHLNAQVYTSTQAVTIPAGQSQNINFTWLTPTTDFQGYFVYVDAGTMGTGTSAIDISSNWTKYPRYGYLSQFPTTETSAQSSAKINQMAQDYHLNALQYYDWMWRHDTLFQRTNGVVNSTWQDLFNRTISWQTIQNQIAATHTQNMAAMAYAMVYAARENYSNFGVDPSWGIYQDNAHASQMNVDFGNHSTYLWMFDPANPQWQNYIFGQYKDAVNTAGFDGIHVDQMGERDTVYDYAGDSIDLSARFNPFLNAAKTALTTNNSAKNKLTFNIVDGTVNGWAANDVSTKANTDFNYSEIWYKSNSYMQLKNYIDSLRANSNNKAVVLAGYMDYNQNIGPLYEAETAQLTGGLTVNTNHPGYDGTGFVDNFTSVGQAVTFTINAPEQGHYSLVFQYGNATGGASTRNLYVDGSLVTTLSFNNQPNWDTWAHDIWYQVDLTPGNHTVKLSYDSGNTGAINLDSLTLGTFDDNSVRLADAMMAASGATHIELGDNNEMLAHEYYPNESKSMRNSLMSAMRDHYSFITAYENLLFDSNVQNNDSGGQFIQIANQTLSGDGTANTIWHINKRTPDYDIVHLINLVGNTDNSWRYSKNTPTAMNNLATKVYIGANETISSVNVASPDVNGGQTQSLSFTTGTDSNGTYVSFTLPSLQYWDMIYLQRSFSTPSNNLYEAETAIKTNVTTNTNHAGYTGSGFVDGFSTSNAGVSFVVNAATESDYVLRFRYGNGGANASRDVYVDGNSLTTLQFNGTGNWDTWAYQEATSHLKPGYHTIVIWYNTSNTGAINLDHLVLQPVPNSAASLYMSNWNNMMGIWMASKLNQNDSGNYGPRLGELHYSSDWSTNQIVDYSGFFRDETNAVKYDQIHGFASSGYLDSGGILNSQYVNYNGAALPVTITRNYATVPNQNFMVVQYNITNETASSINWNVMDQVHFNNKNATVNQSASYDAARNAIINDMSATGQYYMALGALQAATSYQIGSDSDSNLTHNTVAPWYAFDNNGTLPNNSSLTSTNIDAAFQNQVTIPAQGTTTLYYYVAIDSSLAALQSDIDALRAQSGSYWFNTTTTAWTNWLNAGKRVNTSDTGVNTAYDRNLIVIKDSQNPTAGSFPASTNPSGYGYNVWARDSAFTAMSLDASGHYTEAEKYWNWLASVQNSDGSFHTRFDLWTSANTNFVEPEHDAIGTFLLGVWKHIQLTGKTASDSFVANIWPAVQKSANFTMNNINSTVGLGAADHSIWEQDLEYYTFTQAMNVAGLYAAEQMAQLESNVSLGDSWNGAAGTILSTIQKNSSAGTSGLWNSGEGYYNQADTTTFASNTLLDSSVNALMGWGVIDAASSRAASTVAATVNTLSHDTSGVARYSGDNFYYTSQYSPAGNESGNLEPIWPQMGNYAALAQLYSGDAASAFTRLQYYAQKSSTGYMPPGEAVSWYYHQPIVSTMSEPLTASSFVMASLAYTNQFDGRIIPPQYNAGAYQTINITSTPSSDWPQWSSVPYYVHQFKDPSPSNTHIKNIAISNDANNIYVRVDNTSGTLPGFTTSPKFAVQVYSEDYNHNAATPSSGSGMYGTLSRPMSYMVGRWSDSNNYTRFHYAGGSWVSDYNITNVIAPQWDTGTGRIELAIPIADLASSGAVTADNWANLNIALITNSGTQWVQDDLQAIHYRINSSTDQWIYGNVR